MLAGKPRTQREIGLLLKAAVDSGTRVACAAGCAPEELPVLANEFRALPTARLVELRRPSNAEMRRILTAMAEAEGTPLGAQMVGSITAWCHGDVRRAIGALARRQFSEGLEARLQGHSL